MAGMDEKAWLGTSACILHVVSEPSCAGSGLGLLAAWGLQSCAPASVATQHCFPKCGSSRGRSCLLREESVPPPPTSWWWNVKFLQECKRAGLSWRPFSMETQWQGLFSSKLWESVALHWRLASVGEPEHQRGKWVVQCCQPHCTFRPHLDVDDSMSLFFIY